MHRRIQRADDKRQPHLLAAFLLLASPIVAAYAIMLHYAVNIPIIDDYQEILGFSLHWQELPTLGSKLLYTFSEQYMEYRLVLLHLLVGAELGLTHHLNFNLLAQLGNVILLPILYVLWKDYSPAYNDRQQRVLWFLPIALLLFGLNYGEGVDWPLSSLLYFSVTFFAIASLHFLVHSTKGSSRPWFAAACASALLACFCAGNAFLLAPLGLCVLLPRKAYVAAALWCSVFALGIAPYFYRYAPLPHAAKYPLLIIPVFFVSFLGSGSPSAKGAIPVGLFIIAAYVAALRSGFYRTHRSAVLGVTWIMGSASLAAIARSHSGLEFSTVSRYRIFSDILLIFCYAYLSSRIDQSQLSAARKRTLYQAALLVAILCCVRADIQGASILRDRRQLLNTALEQYRAAPDVNSPLLFGVPAAEREYAPEKERARQYMQEASRTGLYSPPPP